MAVSALRAHIFKHQRQVALGAPDSLVHAAQWIARLIVTKLRRGADRLPTRISVAVLACTDRRSVGTRHLGTRTLACLRCVVLRMRVHLQACA